jgi:hypothetical protein
MTDPRFITTRDGMTYGPFPPPTEADAQPPSPEENEAYGTACAISSRLVEQYPEISDDLGKLLDAVRTEQRLACLRGRPIVADPDPFAGSIGD